MASLLPISKTCHARSNSLPSRYHPVSVIVEEHLCRLKASDTISSSTSSVYSNLGSLKDFLESLNDLIELPSIQQELSPKPCGKWADKVLDGSVRLLDICGTVKDIMLHMKESVKELESSLRRNRGGESSLAHEIDAYATSRKKVNKMIARCIRSFRKFDKNYYLALENGEDNFHTTVSMLEESEAISFSVLKSVLLYLSGSKDRSKQRGWSLVSKFVQSKRVHCDIEQEEEDHVHDIKKIDDALSALIRQKSYKDNKFIAVQNVLKPLEALEMTIQESEEVLEAIIRSLIKRRVLLLNVLNN